VDVEVAGLLRAHQKQAHQIVHPLMHFREVSDPAARATAPPSTAARVASMLKRRISAFLFETRTLAGEQPRTATRRDPSLGDSV